MVNARELLTLIALIYDCSLDPSLWEQALAHIKNALDCQNAVLHVNDLRRNCVLIHRSVGIEPYWLEQFAKYVPELHGLLPSQPALDEPQVLSRHTAKAVIEASPFVRDWLRPQQISDIMQLFLMHTPSRFSGLGMAWSEQHGLVTDHDIELACLLLPHLRRAVTISNVLDTCTIEGARMAETLNALRCGVVLADARGVVLHANAVAESMLRAATPIHISGGMLRANEPEAAAELRAAIALATCNEAQIGKTGLAIRLNELDTRPVFAHVLPLTGSDQRTQLHPSAVVAVFIGGRPDEQDGADAMAAAFGLTPAETHVLANLLAGRTLVETAVALDIARSTVKTHLDHIFAKAGVTRQADLIRLATGLVPPTKSKV